MHRDNWISVISLTPLFSKKYLPVSVTPATPLRKYIWNGGAFLFQETKIYSDIVVAQAGKVSDWPLEDKPNAVRWECVAWIPLSCFNMPRLSQQKTFHKKTSAGYLSKLVKNEQAFLRSPQPQNKLNNDICYAFSGIALKERDAPPWGVH